MSQYSSHDDTHGHYIRKIRSLPMLDSEQEYTLAKKWREQQDHKAIEKIISSHLRLVAKIANGYRGYGLPLSDLISEGNLGMMQAMKHYDPDKGYRFSTYAMWWIRANIQEYILQSWSLVKLGTTSSQKKLFFSLRKTQQALQKASNDESDFLSPEKVKLIAAKLGVKEEEVVQMHQRMGSKDQSLNAPLTSREDNNSEWIEWIADDTENQEITLIQQDEMGKRKKLFAQALTCLNEREHTILVNRRLKEPPHTLEELSVKIGISRERVRQIENTAFEKLQRHIKKLTPTYSHYI